MRIKVFVAMFLVVLIPLFAQSETLVERCGRWRGSYGVSFKAIELQNRTGIMLGGRGGWEYNGSIFVGGAWHFLLTDIKAENRPAYMSEHIDLYYLALVSEYHIHQERLVHYSISTLIGVGGVGYDRWGEYGSNGSHSDFFVTEAGVNVALNVAPKYIVSFGLGGRLAYGVDLAGMSDRELSGLTATLSFKFGGR